MPETEEVAPSVLRTEPLKHFVPQGNYGHYIDRPKLRDRFDEHPIQEVREACLKSLMYAIYEEEYQWGSLRIKEFLEIGDFKTALMLLKWMIPSQSNKKETLLENILYVFGWVLGRKSSVGIVMIHMEWQKEIVKIFCRYFERNPGHYDERARELIQTLFDGHGVSNENKDGYLILRRVLPMIAKVGDIKLLPLVQEYVMPYQHRFSQCSLKGKYEYITISHESLEVDAWARQAVFVLENIAAGAEQTT